MLASSESIDFKSSAVTQKLQRLIIAWPVYFCVRNNVTACSIFCQSSSRTVYYYGRPVILCLCSNPGSYISDTSCLRRLSTGGFPVVETDYKFHFEIALVLSLLSSRLVSGQWRFYRVVARCPYWQWDRLRKNSLPNCSPDSASVPILALHSVSRSWFSVIYSHNYIVGLLTHSVYECILQW